ncbi:hypothetical protein [Bryobacter aggregatus]|uniref:hypothetical protein n=1 Tax=Bryobacter aggregatus TaxID=360054 RepID=UPI0004E1B89F|nr:hypothetical protein [Bryobacter aggregatus]
MEHRTFHAVLFHQILALTAVLSSTLAAQSLLLKPDYSGNSITSAAALRPGRIAPNTLLTIYGENLSHFSWAIREQDLHSPTLPTTTPNGEVYVQVQGLRLPLYFVSPKQINVLLPADFDPGTANLRVFRDLVSGPTVAIAIQGESPELFRGEGPFAAATHADGSIITPSNPAAPGEIIVLYGTGFGAIQVKERNTLVPTLPAEVKRRTEYRARVDGVEIDSNSIFYVGVTPGYAGLYQMNLRLPGQLGDDPILEIGIGGNWSDPGTRLNVRSN